MRQLLQKIRHSPLTLVISLLAITIGTSDSLATLCDIHLHGQFGAVQLMSCHLTHWSLEHLFWDLSMFAILGTLCERVKSRAFYATVLSSALCIPMCLMHTNPEIDIYRGLSGIDTGIFALFASWKLVAGISQRDNSSAVVFAVMLALLWCKIGFELWSGQVLFVQQVNFEPLPIAHAVGALIGSLMAVGHYISESKSRRGPTYETSLEGNLAQ